MAASCMTLTVWLCLLGLFYVGDSAGYDFIETEIERRGERQLATSAVSQWPHDVAIKEGEVRRIPFTFKPGVPFSHAQIKGADSLYVLSAKPGEPQLWSDRYFRLVEATPFDLMLNYSDPEAHPLGVQYRARVKYRDRKKEQRTFQISFHNEAECGFKHSSSEGYISVDDNITLSCKVSVWGDLTPDLTWTDCQGKTYKSEYKTIVGQSWDYIYKAKALVVATDDFASCGFTCNIKFSTDPEATGSTCNVAVRMKSVVESEGEMVKQWPKITIFPMGSSTSHIKFILNPHMAFHSAVIAKIYSTNYRGSWEVPVLTATPSGVVLHDEEWYELVSGSQFDLRIRNMSWATYGLHVARVLDSTGRAEQKFFYINGYTSPPICKNRNDEDGNGNRVGEKINLDCSEWVTGGSVTMTWQDCNGNILNGQYRSNSYNRLEVKVKKELDLCEFKCSIKFEFEDHVIDGGNCSVRLHVKNWWE